MAFRAQEWVGGSTAGVVRAQEVWRGCGRVPHREERCIGGGELGLNGKVTEDRTRQHGRSWRGRAGDRMRGGKGAPICGGGEAFGGEASKRRGAPCHLAGTWRRGGPTVADGAPHTLSAPRLPGGPTPGVHGLPGIPQADAGGTAAAAASCAGPQHTRPWRGVASSQERRARLRGRRADGVCGRRAARV
eukprot:359546-Chlamydomonas_euryale.AAC.1